MIKIKYLVISVLIIFLVPYILLGLYAYFKSDSIIFQPQNFSFKDDYSVIKLPTPNGEKISAKFFKNQKALYTILYSHGNAEDIFSSTPFFEELSNVGFNVLAYDYCGYGTSEGSPSEKNSYEDIETAYNFLINEQKILPEKIIIHGRSLGGAVAIDLASRKKCGGLIVESSFLSAFRVMTGIRLYPFDKFESIYKIGNVKCPVLFIHGTNDNLIPYWHGQQLFEKANQPKIFYAVENAGHNDLVEVAGKEYFEQIKRFSITFK
ncbi:MAG TPA: alpha/beta hydrolase [Pyrinomonadaceae bacterium]|nr:alpha/beta hydrolase [Pyrinomonadaceae bacterium]